MEFVKLTLKLFVITLIGINNCNGLTRKTLDIIARTRDPYIPYEQCYPYLIDVTVEEAKGTAKGNVFLFHDYYDNATLWEKINVMSSLAKSGYNAYAMDFPGLKFSASRHKEKTHLAHEYEVIPMLRSIFTELGIAEAVLVTPVYAVKYGMYVISEFDGPEMAAGLILISPKTIQTTPEKIANIKQPVLGIYGSKDSKAKSLFDKMKTVRKAKFVEIPDVRREFFQNTKNPQDDPAIQQMIDEMIKFLDGLKLKVGGVPKQVPECGEKKEEASSKDENTSKPSEKSASAASGDAGRKRAANNRGNRPKSSNNNDSNNRFITNPHDTFSTGTGRKPASTAKEAAGPAE